MKKLMDGIINISIGHAEKNPNIQVVSIRIFGFLVFKKTHFIFPD